MDIRFAGRIQTDSRVLLGKPVVKGTRISVGFLLNALATMTVEEILEAYPFLTREDIVAALRYAAAVVDAPGAGKEEINGTHGGGSRRQGGGRRGGSGAVGGQ